MKRNTSKVKSLQPPCDFIALGKQRSGGEIGEARSLSKSLQASTSSGDRKKAEIPCASPVKKHKLVPSTSRPPVPSTSSKSSRDVAPKPGASSGPNEWDLLAEEVESAELLNTIIKADRAGDTDRVASLLCGCVRVLRNSARQKSDPTLYLTLMFLAKAYPNFFTVSDVVIDAFCSLLKRDHTINFKGKGNNLVCILAANILLVIFQDRSNWPEQFIKIFIEDSLGDRVWVDHDECKGFVDNILTAFKTIMPPKSMMAPEFTYKPDACPSPPAGSAQANEDEDSLSSLHLDLKETQESISVTPRYKAVEAVVEKMILDVIQEQLARRQPTDISRNLLRLLICTCGISEVRLIVAHRLEVWLQNPKLTRPAQDLLLTMCMNCNQHNKNDVEVISQLIRVRLKTKPVINHFLQCVKELLGLHPENLSTVLRHAIYNELSQTRNPNNMSLISVIFQHSPQRAAGILAEVFQDLLTNRDDYLRCLRALLREIVRTLRHDMDFVAFCNGLTRERKEPLFTNLEQEFRERLFLNIVDLITISIFLGISPTVRECAAAIYRGEKRDTAPLDAFLEQAATIQRDAVMWLHGVVCRMFRLPRLVFVHALNKLLFREQVDHYSKDNWPPEPERPLLFRLVWDVPVLEDTLIRILLTAISKDHPFNAADALEIVDSLVHRCAAAHRDKGHPVLSVKRPELIEFLFSLCQYHQPDNYSLPAGYTPPLLAISDYYWKVWIMLLIMCAHNPQTYGDLAWNHYPTLRSMMEMCITNHFAFPPPTITSADEVRALEVQTAQQEKLVILEFETHLAAASTKATITEQTSLLLSKLITLDAKGPARKPPQQVLDQLKQLNQTLKLGHLLCRSRRPDFLLDIIQQQGTSQSMPWLAELVDSNEGSFDILPVQCLCEFLLTDTMDPETDAERKMRLLPNKRRKYQQLLGHLQGLLRDPEADLRKTGEVLDYFMRRLSSPQLSPRVIALKGLQLILGKSEEERTDEDGDFDWLLDEIPELPHFKSILEQVIVTLRQALHIETDPSAIVAYVVFLATHTPDEFLSDLSLDIARLTVERPTIINCILPQDSTSFVYGDLFLSAILDIYIRFLVFARRPCTEEPWYDTQEMIRVKWSTGESADMHVLIANSMIMILTYGPPSTLPERFMELLDVWFSSAGVRPQAYLVDTHEEAQLLPEWLKLKMIRSPVDVLVDAALRSLDAMHLVLFIQSFGIPVKSMSKLLTCLDHAVEYDAEAVMQAVVDKTYMCQLVEVQHQRGAVGGMRYYQLLGETESQETAMQVTEAPRATVASVIQHAPPRTIKPSKSDGVAPILIQLFDLESSGRLTPKLEQELYRSLQKGFISDNAKKRIFDGTLAEFIHICGELLDSPARQVFVNQLHTKFSFSSSLFQLAIRSLKQVASNSPLVIKFQLVVSKILQCSNAQTPLLKVLKNCVERQGNAGRGRDTLLSSLAAGLKIQDTSSFLEHVISNHPNRFEEALCALVQRSIRLKDSSELVAALTKILLSDKLYDDKMTTRFIIIDMVEHLEPECISAAPDLQSALFFQRGVGESKTVFRPYLLSLLIHRARWSTLKSCIETVLSPVNKDSYDPVAVLDFLSACMYIPKIWQGRDKKLPKHQDVENILVLRSDQLKCVAAYIIEEAKLIKDEKSSMNRMSSRMHILEQSSHDKRLIAELVDYLVSLIDTEDKSAARSLLVQLYLSIPNIIFCGGAVEDLLRDIPPQLDGHTKVDTLSHTLLLALSVCDTTKNSYQHLKDLMLGARKLAATHPILLLRQLPLIASLLNSRLTRGTPMFGTKTQRNSFFVCILGLLELTKKWLFLDSYLVSVKEIFVAFINGFLIHTRLEGASKNPDDNVPTAMNRFFVLAHDFMSECPDAARQFITDHGSELEELSAFMPQMLSLKSLLSGMSLVHCSVQKNTGSSVIPSLQDDDVFLGNAPFKKDSRLCSKLDDNPEEVLLALENLEAVAVRKPDILEHYQEELQQLLLSPNIVCCKLAFKLLLQCIQNNPSISGQFISSYLQCLANERRDIVLMALERLPEFVVLAEEHGSLLLQKAFQVGISTNISSALHISDTLLLLNMQYGN